MTAIANLGSPDASANDRGSSVCVPRGTRSCHQTQWGMERASLYLVSLAQNIMLHACTFVTAGRGPSAADAGRHAAAVLGSHAEIRLFKSVQVTLPRAYRISLAAMLSSRAQPSIWAHGAELRAAAPSCDVRHEVFDHTACAAATHLHPRECNHQ